MERGAIGHGLPQMGARGRCLVLGLQGGGGGGEGRRARARPGELEAGLVVALVGAPVLLLVVRRSQAVAA